MSGFNRMTIVAAAEVISFYKSHADIEVLEVQWGINGRYSSNSKSARVAGLSAIAIDVNPEVMTPNGMMKLSQAIVEVATLAPPAHRANETWDKFLAGLRFDGFDLVEVETQKKSAHPWETQQIEKRLRLTRMLPKGIPEADFREAENEINLLLNEFDFTTARGHLAQAISAFQRGEWSSANGELRNFFENHLNEIALALGYEGKDCSKSKRDFLGAKGFFISDYNEWNSNSNKHQFFQGLMSRMHPHGGHEGLSEEEDATFRLQIILVTARLILRRYKHLKASIK